MKKFLIVFAILSIAFRAQAQNLGCGLINSATQDAFRNKRLQVIDSIQSEANYSCGELKNRYDSLEQGYNRIISHFRQKIDSLNEIGISTKDMSEKLNSLSLTKNTEISKLQSKLDDIKSRTIEEISKLNLPPELNDELLEYTNAFREVSLSSSGSGFLPSALSASHLRDLSIPELKTSGIEGLTGLTEIRGLPSTGGITDVAEPLQNIKQGIPHDMTSVDQLAKVAETQVLKINEINA